MYLLRGFVLNKKWHLTYVILLSLIAINLVKAEEVNTYIPFVFSMEEQDIETKICMEIIKNDFPHNKGEWKNVVKNSQNLELTFLVDLITSIQDKNPASFTKMVHPVLANDKARVKEQQEAYFEQFSVLEILAVKGIFKFSSYQVIFLTLKHKDKIYTTDFLFSVDSSGQYKFLPYKSKSLTASTFYSWAHSEFGYLGDKANYCKKGLDNDKNYEFITLEDTSYYIKPISNKNKATLSKFIEKQNKFLEQSDMNSYLQTLSTSSKSRISKWLETANEKEKKLFINANINSNKFFVIDSKPLYIAFNQSKRHGRYVVFLS